MKNKCFWRAAALVAGIGSFTIYATAGNNEQTQESFHIMTTEEAAAIQNKLDTMEGPEKEAYRKQQYQEFVKRAESAGYIMPAKLPAQPSAVEETTKEAAEAEVAVKPVTKPTPTAVQAPTQKETTPDNNTATKDTVQKDTEAEAIESHRARMAKREEMIRQAAEQQGKQQAKLLGQQQSTDSSRPATDADTTRQAMDQRRQQVPAEIKKRRQSAEKNRLESGYSVSPEVKRPNDALDTLQANEEARDQLQAQRRAAAERAMEARHAEMEQRIQQRQNHIAPGAYKSQEEIISTMQDHRKSMREYMAKRRAELIHQQDQTKQENKVLAQAEENRARREAMHRQRQLEIEARRKAMHQRIDAAIDGMGRNPWGQPPPQPAVR